MSMKTLFILSLAIFTFSLAHGSPHAQSWFFNRDGGFGIYQPEGWTAKHSGRSSTLLGPSKDVAQSEIFLGSDWNGAAKDIESLKAVVAKETGELEMHEILVSGLRGLAVGSEEDGSFYVLRIPENFIVVHFHLRGSIDQIDEGRTMLGSIEIRTRGIDN